MALYRAVLPYSVFALRLRRRHRHQRAATVCKADAPGRSTESGLPDHRFGVDIDDYKSQ